MRENLKGVVIVVSIVLGGTLAMYLFLGFLTTLFTDPLNIVPDVERKERTVWDECVVDAERIFDDFNDTVGASYAHEDKPSTEVQSFIDRCMENKLNEKSHE